MVRCSTRVVLAPNLSPTKAVSLSPSRHKKIHCSTRLVLAPSLSPTKAVFLSSPGCGLQAQLTPDGWSLATLESLRSVLASEAEKEASAGLDPYHWFKYLIQYREIPHYMTTFKRKGELQTEQQVFQVSCCESGFGPAYTGAERMLAF